MGSGKPPLILPWWIIIQMWRALCSSTLSGKIRFSMFWIISTDSLFFSTSSAPTYLLPHLLSFSPLLLSAACWFCQETPVVTSCGAQDQSKCFWDTSADSTTSRLTGTRLLNQISIRLITIISHFEKLVLISFQWSQQILDYVNVISLNAAK